MGLGKTVITLGLILANPRQLQSGATKSPVSPSDPSQKTLTTFFSKKAAEASTTISTKPPAQPVVAHYGFDGACIAHTGGLTLVQGDAIHVTDKGNDAATYPSTLALGWWKGSIGERSGWFPASYVRRCRCCWRTISCRCV